MSFGPETMGALRGESLRKWLACQPKLSRSPDSPPSRPDAMADNLRVITGERRLVGPLGIEPRTP